MIPTDICYIKFFETQCVLRLILITFEKLLPLIEGHQDCGPPGEGWQSRDLEEAIRLGKLATKFASQMGA